MDTVTSKISTLIKENKIELIDLKVSDALIEQWIEIKNKEFNQISNWPSPIEYSMYFDF